LIASSGNATSISFFLYVILIKGTFSVGYSKGAKPT
jgi:hypothetical protein